MTRRGRVQTMDKKSTGGWNRRRWGAMGVAAAVAGTVGYAAVRWSRPSGTTIPTAEVRRGEFVDYIQIRGEVKSLNSVVLSAPLTAGDVQIIKIVRTGAPVKKGDVVVQFDFAALQRTLDQKRSELRQAEAEIEQARAQARLKQEQDRTDVMKARYDVERARLEASKQEILSKIEGEKTKLTLADAEQKLREIEAKEKSDQASAKADIEIKQQKRDKALFEVRKAERDIAAMTLKAPTEGIVTIFPNERAGDPFSDTAPEFKEGDRAWPGAAIAELPDLSNLRVSVRVDEIDRGRLKSGQTATVRVDAVPDKEFSARLAEISPLAKIDFSSWPFKKNFDMVLRLEQTDSRLRPGMSATTRVAVERIADSIVIPVEGSFQKTGKTVSYVLRGSRFEERAIDVARRGSETLLVASGLKPGERIALKDPSE